MGKLQGYDRKNYMRHRTTKQQRMVNKGIDMVFKGASAVGKASSKTPSSSQEAQAQLPTVVVCSSVLVGLFAFLICYSKVGIIIALVFGFIAFFVGLFVLAGVYGGVTGARERKAEMKSEEHEAEPHLIKAEYNPNPEWMGQMGLVDSRTNAQILAPQFMKQVLESAKILQTTTEPGTFFTRYDFCVGRLMELEECKKYGVSVSTTQDLKKYRSMDFREEAVEEIICRTQGKYRDKIESLKTQKAKQNWATKYHRAFEPYLSYMSDNAKTKLGECSAELYALTEI